MNIEQFHHAVATETVLQVRVVPVPLETRWCIDVLIKESFKPGARTDTLEADRIDSGDGELARFTSIDECAAFLRECGVREFIVNMEDSVSFVGAALEAEKAEPHPTDADGASDVVSIEKARASRRANETPAGPDIVG